MGSVKKQRFSLSAGRPALPGNEVARAGLRTLQEQEAAIERWLNEEVGSTYDAIKTGTEEVQSATSVFTEARARYAGKRKNRR